MVLGISLPTFTLLHVILSLIGIGTGVVVVLAMLVARRLAVWTALFMATTILTSVTDFMFPSKSFGPPHVVGAISLIVLAVAVLALYVNKLAGSWRWIYVGAAVLSLYLNAFVGVVQAFLKIPSLHA